MAFLHWHCFIRYSIYDCTYKMLHGINENYLFPVGRIYVFQIQDYQKHHNSSPSMHLSVLVAMKVMCPKMGPFKSENVSQHLYRLLVLYYGRMILWWWMNAKISVSAEMCASRPLSPSYKYLHLIVLPSKKKTQDSSTTVMIWSNLGPGKSPSAPASASSPLEIISWFVTYLLLPHTKS